MLSVTRVLVAENVNPYLILVNPVNPNSAVKVLQGMFSPDELVAELDQVSKQVLSFTSSAFSCSTLSDATGLGKAW